MLLLIDKPKGVTSHDVVDVIRKYSKERRVGHAGTLDPNATGLLIVGVGREDTKKLGSLTKDTTKTYIAEIVLGEARDTDDVEGKVIERDDKLQNIEKRKIEEVLNSFVGKQMQTPPAYSAIKLNGKKAYELARKGQTVRLEPREIEVFEARLLSYDFPTLSVEFHVSSGTYIRSLARDIAKKLGTVGYLSNLRRTKIGDYSIEEAKQLQYYSSR